MNFPSFFWRILNLFSAENKNFFIKNIRFVSHTPPLGLCCPGRMSHSSFPRPCIHTVTSINLKNIKINTVFIIYHIIYRVAQKERMFFK